jgi:photosystem II stability/assembly factor-like uncharacterized protein
MKGKNIWFMVFVCFSMVNAQWRPLNNFTNNVWLNSVYFTDDDNGWIAGSEGTILKFNPELMNWERIFSGTSQHLNSIGFFNNLNGITAGEDGTLLFSSDGGNTWLPDFLDISGNLNEIFILNSTTAYIAGDDGILLKTTNRGSDWSRVYLPGFNNLRSVHFITPDRGYVGSDSALLFYTPDGGDNWFESNFSGGLAEIPGIDAIFFIDSLTGYIGGGGDFTSILFQKTTDGGLTWNQLPDAARGKIRDIKLDDQDNGIVVGGSNTWDRFLTVKNGAGFQTLIYHNEDYDIMSCFITPSGRGWAVGGGGSVFFADEFTGNWGQLFMGSEDRPEALSVSTDNLLFFESSRNNFRDPGGVTIRGFYNNRMFRDVSHYWDLSGGDYLRDLQMIDSLYGYKYPSLKRTTNGGFNWEPLFNSPWDERMHFISRSTGWIYGEEIHKTINGGEEWLLQYQPDFFITELTFIGNTGYACGSDNEMKGRIIKSTDGGNTWTELIIPTAEHLTSVSFTNEEVGVVTGWGSTILITLDGGETWRKVSGHKAMIREMSVLKPAKYKNDKRVKIIKNSSGKGFRVWRVLSEDNYLHADFRNDLILIASDGGKVLKSFNYGRGWMTEELGEAVLEVKFDGIEDALARTAHNVYIQKITDWGKPALEIISFNARIENNTVLLEWKTNSGDIREVFSLQRSTSGEWKEISRVGSNSADGLYSYYDYESAGFREIKYRLMQRDSSGVDIYSEEISILSEIRIFSLEQNYPNPFNPSTKITYALPVKEYVEIRVTDALGREIILLENSFKEEGVYELTFDARAHNLSSGIYFYTIKAGDFLSSRKMVLLK